MLVVSLRRQHFPQVCGCGYIIESGRVAAEGAAADLKNRSDLQALYLGLDAAWSQAMAGWAG